MSGHLPMETFDANARAALLDRTLNGALKRATDRFAGQRRAAIDAMPEWEAMRERAREIKAEVLADLDRYLEDFSAKAEAAGARVHWARDGDEACRLIAGIARDANGRRLVKSKSMTTEEIGLNRYMAEAARNGEEPVETDLGEWIIQLAGEVPSHIIAPAIHKTKEQIADLFVEKLVVEEGTGDIEALTAAARRVLRRHFAEADVGISGVNFAVAETGTVLVLENEGNARMCTTLPSVHVAVMGIEKLLPRFADLEVFLRLLPRSGTGQHLTSYQSLITGPKRSPDGEGPDEVHVVLLDNGRSAMLRERVTRQSLACIRCGACLNACPVYQQIGGHAYGSVYPGPIGAVITPQLAGLEKAAKLPFASSLCGACRDVCPVKIDIPELLLHLRSEIKSGKGLPHARDVSAGARSERIAFRLWSWTMRSPLRYRAAAACARLLARIGIGIPGAGAWRAGRELRPFARRSFRSRWESRGR